MSELTPEESPIHDALALETFRELRAWGQEEER